MPLEHWLIIHLKKDFMGKEKEKEKKKKKKKAIMF